MGRENGHLEEWRREAVARLLTIHGGLRSLTHSYIQTQKTVRHFRTSVEKRHATVRRPWCHETGFFQMDSMSRPFLFFFLSSEIS